MTSSGGFTIELRARGGRAVLVTGGEEVDPEAFGLPGTVVRALHEWAGVVASLPAGGQDSGQVAARRARQLAVRLAVETGGEVAFLDPVTGERSVVGRQRPTRERPTEPVAARPAEVVTGRPAGPAAVAAAEPTPWGTGLLSATIIAAIVVVALVIITTGLAEVSPLLAVVVNLAVAAGLAPSIWLGRSMRFWRWIALGGTVGIVLSWVALLLGTLG